MMEWSYIYLAIPPLVAIGAAVIAALQIKRSAARITEMQRRYDEDETQRQYEYDGWVRTMAGLRTRSGADEPETPAADPRRYPYPGGPAA